MLLMDPRIVESMQQKPYVPPDTLNDSLRTLDMEMQHILNREDLSPHDKMKQYQKTLQLYTTRLSDYKNKPLGLIDVKPPAANTPTTTVDVPQEPSITTEPKKETIDIPDSETKQTASPETKARPAKKKKKTHQDKTPPAKRTRSKASTTPWEEWQQTKH